MSPSKAKVKWCFKRSVFVAVVLFCSRNVVGSCYINNGQLILLYLNSFHTLKMMLSYLSKQKTILIFKYFIFKKVLYVQHEKMLNTQFKTYIFSGLEKSSFILNSEVFIHGNVVLISITKEARRGWRISFFFLYNVASGFVSWLYNNTFLNSHRG